MENIMSANILVDSVFANCDNANEIKNVIHTKNKKKTPTDDISLTSNNSTVDFSKPTDLDTMENLSDRCKKSSSECSRLEQSTNQIYTPVDESSKGNRYKNDEIEGDGNKVELKDKMNKKQNNENEYQRESAYGSNDEFGLVSTNGSKNEFGFESASENEKENIIEFVGKYEESSKKTNKIGTEFTNKSKNENGNDEKGLLADTYKLNLNAKERFMQNKKNPKKIDKTWKIGYKINEVYRKNKEEHNIGDGYTNADNRRDYARRKSRKSYYRSSVTQIRGYATGYKSGYIIDLPPENKNNDEKNAKATTLNKENKLAFKMNDENKNTKENSSKKKKKKKNDKTNQKETIQPRKENLFFENIVLCCMGISSVILYNYFLNTTPHINGLLNKNICTSDIFLLYFLVLIAGSVCVSFFFELNVFVYETCFILSIALQIIYPFIVKHYINSTLVFQALICCIAVVCSVLKTMVFSISSVIQENSKIICFSYGLAGMYSFLFTFFFYFGIIKIGGNAEKFIQAVFSTSIINSVFMFVSFICYIILKRTPKYAHKMQNYFDSCEEKKKKLQQNNATHTDDGINQENRRKFEDETLEGNEDSDKDLESNLRLRATSGEKINEIEKQKKLNKEKKQQDKNESSVSTSSKRNSSFNNVSTLVPSNNGSQNGMEKRISDDKYIKHFLIKQNGQGEETYASTKEKKNESTKQLLDMKNSDTTTQEKGHNKHSKIGLYFLKKYEDDPNCSYMLTPSKSCCSKWFLANYLKKTNVVNELKHKMTIYRKAWMSLFCVFYNIFLKVLIFPIVCPEMWTNDTNFRYVLIGFTQMAECLSRIFPTFSPNINCFSFFLLSPKKLFYLTLSRTLLALLCFAVAIYDNVVFNHYIFKLSLIFIYMYLNGWYVVTSFINIPLTLGNMDSPKNRAAVSSFGSSLLRLGLLAGFAASRIFKYADVKNIFR